ncbi:fluG [Verticillium alfalfae VaMs.102]|uniref:Glutamine synthetase n=1 Tax=Verticillium alfalfae (strain VaMs.102 / ATCC MYA-4576 / FGSC 10136) TaxID=526221 RepID=C9SCN8_VERA1|nr:fluG [Verticillium alfalfae VaMs.102]EEY16853.1 fluG [Verticillium alfalfae VaMs.102]
MSLSNGSSGTNGSTKVTPILQQLRKFNSKWLRLCWHDYTSTARCRLVPMKRVLALLECGEPFSLPITKASLGMLQTDALVPEITGTGMYEAFPDWLSLRQGPVPGHASVFLDFKHKDGSDVDLCPRTLLRNTLASAEMHGLSFLLGFELEFVILETCGENQPQALRHVAHGWSLARAIADCGRHGSFNSKIDELLDNLQAAGIEIEQLHTETGPGQYEIVLPPLTPLEACDTLLRTRHIIEAVAMRNGFHVTLHPKPFAGGSGSASHNKEAPLRKCVDSHWEMKTLDGLANPYIAVAGILAAGTDGLVKGEPLIWLDCAVDPAKLTDEQRQDLGVKRRFPKNLGEALDALKSNEVLKESLGREVVQRYTDVKNGEMHMMDSMTEEARRKWIIERY